MLVCPMMSCPPVAFRLEMTTSLIFPLSKVSGVWAQLSSTELAEAVLSVVRDATARAPALDRLWKAVVKGSYYFRCEMGDAQILA